MSELPRVTDILASVGIIDRHQYERYPEARDRGSAVHMACHYDDIGDLDESSLDPIIVPYLTAWRRFRAEHECHWTEIEQRLEHPFYRYCGTPDRLGSVDGHLAIVDIKTGAKEHWHPIQLAGYALFDRDFFKYNCLVVRLNAEGNYALDIYKLLGSSDIQVFLSALNVYNYFRRINGNRTD